MISIMPDEESKHLLLVYTPNNGTAWLKLKLEEEESVDIHRVFNVSKTKLVNNLERGNISAVFLLATVIELDGKAFYHIDKEVLKISFDLYISTDCRISEKLFIGARGVSVFRIIDKFWKEKELYIGFEGDCAISEKDFRSAIKSLPNNTELIKYTEARICRTFKNILPVKKDSVTQFQKYINKKLSNSKESRDLNDDDFSDFDMFRYRLIYEKMSEMLYNENGYDENTWQRLILKFIQVLFPKYVFIGNKPTFRTIQGRKKQPDIIMGDADGYIDIIEIKMPFATGVLSARKSQLYRDNYIPLRELSGAVMQCEKYIFNMTSNMKDVLKELNSQYKSTVPGNYEFKIVNPKAMIIMGRSNDFSEDQKKDFEIIKRKYKNIIDIITYDDLLHRLETTISILENQNEFEKSSSM